MAEKILMPKLGLTMKTGTVIKWLKDEGEPVSDKEPVLEIETEKLSHQIEAAAAGVLIKRIAEVGEKYPVSCVLGYIGSLGENVDITETGGSANPKDSPSVIPILDCVPEAARVFISPVAKNLAESAGIDYKTIKGTGPNGRITKEDVRKVMEHRTSPSFITDNAVNSFAEDRFIPYSGKRRVIGERMFNAWATIPMVTHHVMADVTELLEYREKLNQNVTDKNDKVSVNDLMLKLTATALADMPIVNSTLTDKGIILFERVHIGMATAVDDGLVVPVIRDANRKGLLQISGEAKDLALRARTGGLGLDEMMGGTFTVTNLGGYGSVDLFTPIINPPQAAILGIGRTTQSAVPVDGEIMIRSTMGLSLTYDHRIIDGATAALFVKKLLLFLAAPVRSVLL